MIRETYIEVEDNNQQTVVYQDQHVPGVKKIHQTIIMMLYLCYREIMTWLYIINIPVTYTVVQTARALRLFVDEVDMMCPPSPREAFGLLLLYRIGMVYRGIETFIESSKVFRYDIIVPSSDANIEKFDTMSSTTILQSLVYILRTICTV